jgi:hypothetical protein
MKNYSIILKDNLTNKEILYEADNISFTQSRGIDKVFSHGLKLVPNNKLLCILKLWDNLSEEEIKNGEINDLVYE